MLRLSGKINIASANAKIYVHIDIGIEALACLPLFHNTGHAQLYLSVLLLCNWDLCHCIIRYVSSALRQALAGQICCSLEEHVQGPLHSLAPYTPSLLLLLFL